jgi:hypothetical protein
MVIRYYSSLIIPDKTRASTLGDLDGIHRKKTSSEGDAGDIHHRRRIIPENINGVLLIGGQISPGRYCARLSILGEIIMPQRIHKKPQTKNNQYGKNYPLQKREPPPLDCVIGGLHVLQEINKPILGRGTPSRQSLLDNISGIKLGILSLGGFSL